MSAPRVIVGVSGGVDSAVAALRLRAAGESVAGLFMQNWDDDAAGASVGDQEADDGASRQAASGCRAEADRRDALGVCARLGIPFHARNFAGEYWSEVFEHFLDEYRAGRTPNPDVLCNREIKFKTFLDAARALGAEQIATGHYARSDCRDGRWRLLRAVDRDKDQTYFLHQLGQSQLAATLFPIGDMPKPDVRRAAAEAGLPVAQKKDSTGICFIGEQDFRAFLSRWLPAQPGEIRGVDGDLLGRHAGVSFYTLGQREGLGLGGVRGRAAAPWYVVGKDIAANVLVVDQGSDSPWLLSRRLASEPAHWIAGEAPAAAFNCSAQVRHRQAPQACRVAVRADGGLDVAFESAQRAVAPGQSVVLYDGDECLGGAVVAATDARLGSLAAETGRAA